MYGILEQYRNGGGPTLLGSYRGQVVYLYSIGVNVNFQQFSFYLTLRYSLLKVRVDSDVME